jgi:hypothetical protein
MLPVNSGSMANMLNQHGFQASFTGSCQYTSAPGTSQCSVTAASSSTGGNLVVEKGNITVPGYHVPVNPATNNQVASNATATASVGFAVMLRF